jgi:O-antigen/teichoic acid export membrane protein
VFAKTLAFAFSFVLPLLLVRRLSQGDFGIYKQVFLVAGTGTALFSLSFGTSAFYFLPRGQERQASVIFNILLFNLCAGGLAFLLLLFFPQALASLFNSSELIPYAPYIGFIILLWVFSFFLEVVAVANQETRAATLFIISAQFTKTALLLSAVLLFGSVRALIYAVIVQAVLQTVILFFYLRSRFPGFWRGFDRQVMRRQLAYALPLGCYGLLYTAQLDLHNYFVSHYFGAAAFAIYAVGCFDLPLVGILGESVGSVMLPRVSYLQKQQERREIILVTFRAMRKLAAVYFPLYAFLMITGREFIAFLFTDRYAASWPIFAINLTLIPFNILVLDPITRAYAEHRYYLLKVRAAFIVVLVVALWFGTEHLGLLGAIAAVVAAGLAERGAVTLKFARVLGVTWQDAALLKDVGKLALATVAAAAAAAAARVALLGAKPFVILVVCGVVFTLVYLTLLLMLDIPDDDELDVLRRQAGRLRRLVPRKRTGETLT